MKLPPIVPAGEKLLDSLKETLHPLSKAYVASSSYLEDSNYTVLYTLSIYVHI